MECVELLREIIFFEDAQKSILLLKPAFSHVARTKMNWNETLKMDSLNLEKINWYYCESDRFDTESVPKFKILFYVEKDIAYISYRKLKWIDKNTLLWISWFSQNCIFQNKTRKKMYLSKDALFLLSNWSFSTEVIDFQITWSPLIPLF